MTLSNLSVDLVSKKFDSYYNNRVVLEQVNIHDEGFSLAKLYRMWQKSITGESAGRYKPIGCPILFEGSEVTIWFDFYVYPIPKALEYDLYSTIGDIGKKSLETVKKEHDSIFSLSDTTSIDYSPDSINTSWLTMCYLPGGGVIPYQEITVQNSLLTVPKQCFGVARIKSEITAHKYRLTIKIVKEEGVKIQLSEPVITAAWVLPNGKTATEQLQLEIPECVEYALDMCEGDFADIVSVTKGRYFSVYYSICDGSFLGTRKDDNQSYTS